jgi:acid stress-induced BolA-like protein IbaG/YrbA
MRAIPEVSDAHASTDGYRYKLLVIADCFEGLPKVERQKWVYAQLGDFITSGRIHALEMDTWTPAEWETQRG